ncbi:MAG: ferrous iron transport protein B [Spirochaetaceae bacterium 4572_7]|nr:MAG: ferrous iron transport protein B [Spirochaetaceae bacterium 4572_7]
MQEIKIALVGQPNVGKSMLINSIGDTKLKVGNFSGVTVEKKSVTFSRGEYHFLVTDLPGSYSLTEFTNEEKVTKEFLNNGDYDIILNVLDSTNLERNLYLTTELLLLEQKMVLALNMWDEADDDGIIIDSTQLSKILGRECVKTSALNKTGIDELLDIIITEFHSNNNISKVRFSDTIEEEIDSIVNFLTEYDFVSDYSHRHLAINLLTGDKKTFIEFSQYQFLSELQDILRKAHRHLFIHYDSHNLDEIFQDAQIAFARGAVAETQQRMKKVKRTPTEKLDSVLMHKLIGLPIFLLFMWGLFQLTFTVGAIPMNFLDGLFTFIIDNVKNLLGNGLLASVVGDGALSGVAAVVLFLPNIVILFLGIALLEATGYMSRVAFLLDGFFHKFGLHGKSFIPLVTGFGCTVPAYMAARTLRNEKERLITLFILGFISCSARLPIYVLFIGTFLQGSNAGNMLFFIYLSGAIFALFAAKFLKKSAFKGADEPFVMEMPKYRMPTVKLLYHSVMGQALSYLKKAGTFILFASVLVWFASNFPQPKVEMSQSEVLEQSYLGRIGKVSEPFFRPLGFDWKMSVALEAGLAAKEIVVSTLQVLYTNDLDDSEHGRQKLMDNLRENISLPSAISFIVFVMLYLPCFAASAVFAREAGGVKYLLYLFLFTTATAWVFSFIAFNVTTLFMHL